MGEHSKVSCDYSPILMNVADPRIAANILTFTLLLFRGGGNLSLQAFARKPWLTVYRAHAGGRAANWCAAGWFFAIFSGDVCPNGMDDGGWRCMSCADECDYPSLLQKSWETKSVDVRAGDKEPRRELRQCQREMSSRPAGRVAE